MLKKILLSVVFVLSTTILLNAQTESHRHGSIRLVSSVSKNIKNQPNKQIKVEIHISIGKKSCNCCGLGVCKMEVVVSFAPASEREAYGYISTNGSGFVIEFDKATMSSDTYDAFFSGGAFVLGEDYVLPDDVCSALGIDGGVLTAGSYTITDSGDSYVITI